MKLSVVIPAYNEEERLPHTLQCLYAAVQTEDVHPLHEVIIVDDGSTDCTSSVAEHWKQKLPVTLLRFVENKGKGAALREGVRIAGGDLVLLYDADGATPPCEIFRLVHILMEEDADIVVGSRVAKGNTALVTMSRWRRFLGRIYYFLTRPLVPGIVDRACGCKLFRAEVARHLFSLQTIDRFAYDIEVLCLASTLHYSIKEVSVRWQAVPGSKVRILGDGIEMLGCIALLYSRSLQRRVRTFLRNF